MLCRYGLAIWDIDIGHKAWHRRQGTGMSVPFELGQVKVLAIGFTRAHASHTQNFNKFSKILDFSFPKRNRNVIVVLTRLKKVCDAP